MPLPFDPNNIHKHAPYDGAEEDAMNPYSNGLDFEEKGGKPNPGTPKDGRLSSNKPGKTPPNEPDGDEPPGKKPFPGAKPPFKKR